MNSELWLLLFWWVLVLWTFNRSVWIPPMRSQSACWSFSECCSGERDPKSMSVRKKPSRQSIVCLAMFSCEMQYSNCSIFPSWPEKAKIFLSPIHKNFSHEENHVKTVKHHKFNNVSHFTPAHRWFELWVMKVSTQTKVLTSCSNPQVYCANHIFT